MKGKTIAITGCTTGTGRICACVCLELGAQIIMLNRDSERASSVLNDMMLKAHEIPGVPMPMHIPCDLTSFKSVREAAAKLVVATASTGLDVLCNNAGVMGFPDQATEDGCDIQCQTNHLSHFLLTVASMPALEKAGALRGEARVVNHSSAARKMDDGDNTLDPKYFDKTGGTLGGDSSAFFKGANFKRYQQSKLANVVFTYGLHDRLQGRGSKVKALVAHPGVAPTSLMSGTIGHGGANDLKSMPQCAMNLMASFVMQSEKDASMGIIRCCCDPSVKSGEFYGPIGKNEASTKHDMSEYKGEASLKAEEVLADLKARDALWQMSESSTGICF